MMNAIAARRDRGAGFDRGDGMGKVADTKAARGGSGGVEGGATVT
jgi:hypothetical protein